MLIGLAGSARGQSSKTTPPGSFDPAPWVEDFHQLLREMSSHYANLEWAIQERHMDLPQLRQQTEAKLGEARNEEDARRILNQFVESFGDGHLQIRWPKAQESKPASSTSGQGLCARLDYNEHLSPGLDFSLLSSFTPLDSEDARVFPSGILRLPSAKAIGVLRIGLFSEHAYPEVCERAVRKLNLDESKDCDEKCSDRLQLETGNLLTAALARQEIVFRKAGATAVLIDIARNGGGSDWVDATLGSLSAVALSNSPGAFIKHEHWTKQLQERLQEVEADRRKSPKPNASLEDAAACLRKAIAESRQPCDRTNVWYTGKSNCSLLVKGCSYKSPTQYDYSESADRLPMYVVVDHDTWSAAEYFAALLQDNHAATIVGELTGGAGCGYTDGGIPTKLKNSGAEVKMPDCVRFRADGSNEVNGITPDVLVPWARRDSPYQRVKKLQSAVERCCSQSADSPVVGQLTSQTVVRLPPTAFPTLPGNITKELQTRGCTIPQPSTGKPENVIRGEFAKPGQRDWAVLCSMNGFLSIFVFWNGSETDTAEVYRWEPSDLYYSIEPVGEKYIMDHYRAYGGPQPPPIDHQGVDLGIDGKASEVFYYYQGQWLKLQGAD